MKSLREAAAAHVNNNTVLLGCRRSERTNETDRFLLLGSHQSFGQRVSIFWGQELPDLPPLPLPVLPLRAMLRNLGLRHGGGVIPPPLLQRGLLSCCGMRGTLRNGQSVVGVVGRRGVAVAQGSGTAVPRLESGVCAGSVSSSPGQGFNVELEAPLSHLHVRACAQPGHWWVGSALGEAGSCLCPLDRRLWPAIPVKAFLRAPRASLRHVTLGTWTPNKLHKSWDTLRSSFLYFLHVSWTGPLVPEELHKDSRNWSHFWDSCTQFYSLILRVLQVSFLSGCYFTNCKLFTCELLILEHWFQRSVPCPPDVCVLLWYGV